MSTSDQLQLPSPAQDSRQTSHKRTLSSNFPSHNSLIDDLRSSRNNSNPSSSRTPTHCNDGGKLKLSPPISMNYTTTGNSGLTIDSAYGLNCKRLSTSSSSSSSAVIDDDSSQEDNFPEMVQSDIAHQRPHDRRLSTEELIDVMEKEQEAIVLRLMKEISSLKEENKILRQRSLSRSSVSRNYILGNADESSTRLKRPLLPTPRTSSTSSSRVSTISSPVLAKTIPRN